MKADLGVSPVASLGYTLALMTSMSIGVATLLSNILFILIQIIVTKQFEIRKYIIQLIIAFVVSSFLDFTMIVSRILPEANTLLLKVFYLVLSLFIIALAAFLYLLSGLPMMPYDTLVPTISNQYNIKFSKAKILCDVSTVIIAVVLGLIFLQSWGSVGIGTIISAYFIGKILGVMMKRFKGPLTAWINHDHLDVMNKRMEQ